MTSLSKLQQENELLKKIATNLGFYNYFFELLKTSKTNTEAFHKANDKYHELFGEHKYSSYNSFMNTIKRQNKSKK